MAAIARAQSLEGARNLASQAQSQQQLTNFLNYGQGYQAGLGDDVPLMRQLKLSVGMAGKTAGFTLVGAAILATAVHVHQRRQGREEEKSQARHSAADPLAPALARCQAIGAAAETDRACDAAWAENRRRFFDGSAAERPANRPNTANAVPKER